jgi:hypothetical protein
VQLPLSPLLQARAFSGGPLRVLRVLRSPQEVLAPADACMHARMHALRGRLFAAHHRTVAFSRRISSMLRKLCPRCNPQAGLIEREDIIIDAKSGVSGAGRSAKQNLLYTEIAEGINCYGVGSHRHMPEIEQARRHTASLQASPCSGADLSNLNVCLAGACKRESREH